MGSFVHGTSTGYDNHGCRCTPCHEASKARRRATLGFVHNSGAYTNGCRCDICRAARLAYNREWRARKLRRQASA